MIQAVAPNLDNSSSNRALHPSVNETQSTASAAQRARELYRYFHPPTFRRFGIGGIFKSNVLSSQTELLALRFQCRVLINLIDASHVYRVAESVPPSSSSPNAQSGDTADQLWAQCFIDLVENSICGLTVNDPCPTDGSLPFFELTNVENDPRFAHHVFVRGPPFTKYYFGVPLRTKGGIAIGALAVIDSKPRERPLGELERKYVQTIVDNIITYLELERESHERRRASEMNRSLNLFVDQAGNKSGNILHVPSERPSSNTGGNRSSPSRAPWHNSGLGSTSRDHPKSPPESSKNIFQARTRDPFEETANSRLANASTSMEPASNTHPTQNPNHGQSGDPPFENSFRLAAELLEQSLMLKGEGGVAFLDTAAATVSAPTAHRSPSTGNTEESTNKIEDIEPLSPTYELWLQGGFRGQSSVIASSTNSSFVTGSEQRADEGFQHSNAFVPMSVDDLSDLIENNAHGKLWNFDEREANAVFQLSGNRSSQTDMDIAVLRKSFPGATSLFMYPIWDARSVRWTALFAYSTSRFRAFTPETDVRHMISFCNCITLDLIRLATAAADKQKGDFIGSISHELRSPLHGVLASCELLEDTGLTDFQQSFVETANSCGRTLLDTINMILDYSKITSLERSRKLSLGNPYGAKQAELGHDFGAPSPLDARSASLSNLVASVDLAAVVEEVVEGAVISHAFQGLQHVELSDMSSGARGRTRRNQPASQGRIRSKRPFEVILQIANNSLSSWLYKTQPGTFRRIVMNLVGNAMKYTQNGWVRVHLNVEHTIEPVLKGSDHNSSSFQAPKDVIVLKVEDTGKGMTSEFLDTRIFLPFSQEDTLSPGTGLGLSMVKSLLHMLDGQIHIESTVNHGTTVTVTIPMLQDLRNNSSSSVASMRTPHTGGSNHTPEESNIARLRTSASNCRVAFFLPDLEMPSKSMNNKISEIMKDCIHEYVSNWFNMTISTMRFLDDSADIIIINDSNLEDLLEKLKSSEQGEGWQVGVVVLCDDSTRNSTLLQNEGSGVCMELISKPFGPNKFAKAIKACLDKVNISTTAEAARQGSLSMDESLQFHGSQNERNLAIRDGIRANNDSSNAAMAVKPPPTGAFSSESPESKEDNKSSTAHLTSNISSPPDVNTPSSLTSVKDVIVHPPSPQFSQTQQTTTPQSIQRTPRVLVVDDNLINLQLLEMFMKKLKYSHVSTAKDGKEACEVVEAALTDKQPFDVIFLDLSMPVLDGFSAARRIRAAEQRHTADASLMDRPAPAMIIALTGLASQSDSDQAFAAGVDLYMTKPASFKDISQVMHNWELNGGTAASDTLPHGPLVGKASVR